MQISLAKLQTESLEIVGDVQFAVIEKFTSAYSPQNYMRNHVITY